jgi:hypothetical protein
MLNFLKKDMEKFKKIPDRSVKIQLGRRQRLRNFKNFPRLGGGGGGSADRLTPLSGTSCIYIFVFVMNIKKTFLDFGIQG